MAEPQSADPVADLLRAAPTPQAVRAAAWDAYEQAPDADALAASLKTMALPTHIKAQLWDLKAAAPAATPTVPEAPIADAADPATSDVGTQLQDMSRGRPGVVSDLIGGAKAGLMSTAVHGGDLIRRGLGMERIIDQPDVQALITPPDSVAGKVGYGAEQVAEVLSPAGAVARGVKGARLVTRMGAEGATAAGIAALQGGDPVAAGVVGSAIPAAGALTRSLPTTLRESAEKKVTQALGATKERFKAIAEKRAPEILKRGLRGSRASLLADATEHSKSAGQAIDDVLKEAGDQRVPVGPVMDALEEAKNGFQQVRRIPMADAVRAGLTKQPGARVVDGMVEVPVVLDARPIEQLTRLQQTLSDLGDDATVQQLTAVRRVWDDVVARAGGFAHRSGSQFGVPLAEQTEAWAKREATKAIRKVLAEEVPDLSKVNAEYAFWKDLKDVLTATQKRTQAQGPGLQRIVSASVGAGAGFSSGESMGDRLTNAVLGGIVAPKAVSALTSARWRLVDASARNALADAIASGSPGQIMSAIGRVTAVQGSKLATPSTP